MVLLGEVFATLNKSGTTDLVQYFLFSMQMLKQRQKLQLTALHN